MKRLIAFGIGLLVVSVLAGCASQPVGPGWVTLIDGDKGIENWNRIGDANWRAEDGVIMADKGKGGFLVSKNAYRDFVIYAEFWAETDTNSGIFIRASDPGKVGADSSYEVNIWGVRPEPKYGTGGIVDFAVVPVPPIYRAGGQWNTDEIEAKGADVTVKLNGTVTVTVTVTVKMLAPALLSGSAGSQSQAARWCCRS